MSSMSDQLLPRIFLTITVRLYKASKINTEYYSEDFTAFDVAKITAYYKRKLLDLITHFTIFHQGGQIFGFSYDASKYHPESVASPPNHDEGIEINNTLYYVSGIITHNSSFKNINNLKT